MNAEADRYRQACNQESLRHGSAAAARLHALHNLKLKTAIKESHCSPVHQLVMNAVDQGCANLIASVGSNQATVYDNQHLGSHIGVVTHFANDLTEHSLGGGLQACAWLNAGSWTQHRHGDACLAVAGADGNISVISVTEARVIRLLRGHSKEVVQLACAAGAPTLLASLARDGELQTWDVAGGACTSASASQACSLAVHPNGSCIVTGGRRGALHIWTPPHASGPADGTAAAASPACNSMVDGAGGPNEIAGGGQALPSLRHGCQPLHMEGSGHSDNVDRMLFLSPERLATRSSDGRVCVWDWQQQSLVTSWKVSHTTASCGFNATPDGMYICMGNSRGTVSVYDSADGSRITTVSSGKVAVAIEACALSNDCRQLLAAGGKGFVFRYEHNPRYSLAQDGNKENADANVDIDVAPTSMELS